MTPEKKAELKARYPDAQLLSAGSVDMVIRAPTRPEWRRFKVNGLDENKRPDAIEQLLRDCCVYPEPADLSALLEKRPALAEKFGAKVVAFAIGEEEVVSGNL